MISSISSSDCYRKKFLLFGISSGIMIAFFGIVNCYLGLTIEKSVFQEKYKESSFWQEKVKADPRYAAVQLGDSRTYRGANPEIISRILSLKCYNLGFSSGGLNEEIFRLAETKLSPSAPKTVIILGISPLTLSEESRSNEHYRHILSQKEPAFEQKQILQIFFTPMDKDRWSTIRKFINRKKQEKVRKAPETFQGSGWTSSNRPFSQSGYDRGLEIYRIQTQNYEFSPQSLAELIRYVKIWKKRGFFIFAYRPPTSKEMEDIENTAYDEERVKKAFSDAGGIYLEFPVNAYQTYDASHLTTESANLFSRDLSIKIQSFLTDKGTDKKTDSRIIPAR